MHPDPVKKLGVNNSLASSMQPKTGLDLFGEEPTNTHESAGLTTEETPEVDADADDDYDNWIVDDLGGGLQDEPAAGKRPSDGYIKEMGMSFYSMS